MWKFNSQSNRQSKNKMNEKVTRETSAFFIRINYFSSYFFSLSMATIAANAQTFLCISLNFFEKFFLPLFTPLYVCFFVIVSWQWRHLFINKKYTRIHRKKGLNFFRMSMLTRVYVYSCLIMNGTSKQS